MDIATSSARRQSACHCSSSAWSTVFRIWGFPKIRGTLFWNPHNKDYSILGSILGTPYFGKLPFRVHDLGLRV